MYIRDYIQKYKNEVLTKDNFSHADGALLSMFTLTDIVNILPKDKPIKFKDAMEAQIKLHKMKKMGLLLPLPLTRELYAASKTKRYGGMLVHDYYCNISEDEVTQSTFVQFDLKDGTTIVVFAGTDDTIVGWKENYEIVYGGLAPCLKNALEYADNNLRDDRKYILVGHSKGGMECLYAGLKCRHQDSIISVNDYDGTGYPKEICEELNASPYMDKAVLVLPQGASVGRFFYHPDRLKQTIVHSNEHGVMQHNPLSWRVIGHDFGEVKSFAKGTEKLPNIITDTPNRFTVEELRQFEKDLFATLSKGGSKTLTDIISHLKDVQKAFLKLKADEKRLFLRFMAYLINGRVITKEMLISGRRKPLKTKEKPE